MALRYHRGDHPYLECRNYDEDGELADCDAGYPKIIVHDPIGTEKVASTQMTKDETGVYYYKGYQLTATDLLGWWPVYYEGITDSLERNNPEGFEVI